MIAAVVRWVHEALLWGAVISAFLVYWVWHSHRYPKVHACRHCEGTGTIYSTSPFLGRPVSGPCRWCDGQPWRTRVGAPLSGDYLTPGAQWRRDEDSEHEWCRHCGELMAPAGVCHACDPPRDAPAAMTE